MEGNKSKKGLWIALAAAAAICVGVLAYVLLGAEDPKETVIQAFENIYQEGQTSPMKEIFDFEAMAEAGQTADYEGGMTLTLASSSDPAVSAFTGCGLRLAVRGDRANEKADMNLGVLYGGMDLANLNLYYGDDMVMAALPELSGRVFTLDLGEGLGERLKNSPTAGPYLEANGVDVEGLVFYLTDLAAQIEAQGTGAAQPFDIKALYKRYQEGSQAQENFKAALTVEKGSKGTFTMDGKDVSCRGYHVTVSKDAMISFLRSSSEFFLQDETLRQDYLKQLEMSVRLSELLGTAVTGQTSLSAEELLTQTYDEMNAMAEQMITSLEGMLTDTSMEVYVDSQGRLAAVQGTATLLGAAFELEEDVSVSFDWQLQGGTYLTQNMTGAVAVTASGQTTAVNLQKQGSYDGKHLTGDLAVDVTLSDQSTYYGIFTSTYGAEDGVYNLVLEGGADGAQLFRAYSNGVVDQLEKGSMIHVDIDTLGLTVNGETEPVLDAALTGELYCRPRTGEITAPEGEAMDVLAATEEDWNMAAMELALSLFGLMGQLETGN